MVETIAPVVYGPSRSRYRLAVAAHVAGATLSAVGVGAVAGALGSLVQAPWGPGTWLILAAAALVYLIAEGASISLPTCDLRRQVPEWWRTYFGPMTTAFMYGAGLGLGFYTHLRHGTYAVVVIGALLAGDALMGAFVCGSFGVARGAVLVTARSASTSEGVSKVLADLERLAGTSKPRIINALALATIGLAAITTTLAG